MTLPEPLLTEIRFFLGFLALYSFAELNSEAKFS